MNNNGHHYEVGYKRPPIAGRFPKGRSGNPHGRPKKKAEEFDPGKLLQSIDNEEIVVKIGGKSKRMRKGEISFRQLFTRAIGGSLTDAKLIARMAANYLGPEAEGPSETQIIIVPDNNTSRGETPTDNAGNMTDRKLNGPKGSQSNKGRRQVSIGAQFRKVAKQTISIEASGTRNKMSRWEAYLRQIYTMALNKNSIAAHLLDQLRKQFPGNLLPGDPIFLSITESDAKL
jgi:hypothetical protein